MLTHMRAIQMSTSVMMTTQTWLNETLLQRGLNHQLATTLSAFGAAFCTIYAQAPLDIVRARIFAPNSADPDGGGALRLLIASPAELIS
eukprot:SAG11_NODE_17246_length_524_cov_0.821176_1_plen_89_part_00